jgi:hypothetical protein
MDLSKLSRGEHVIGGSGIALFIFSFFQWLGLKATSPIGGFSAEGSKSGWGFTLTLIAILIGIAMTVLVLVKLFSSAELPAKLGNFTWGQVYLVMGVVAFVFILIKLITGVGGDIPDSIDKTRKIGIYLGLIASAGLAFGGYLKFQEDKSSSGGSSTAPPTAPPAA